MLCSAGANGSHQGQQPVSVLRHDTEYLDRKKPARAAEETVHKTDFSPFKHNNSKA